MSVKSSLIIQRVIDFDPNLKIGNAGPGTKNFFNLKNFIDNHELDLPQPTQQFAIRGWGNLPAPGTQGYTAPQGTWRKHNPTDFDGQMILILKWVAMCLNLETDHSMPWSKSKTCHWSNIRVIPKSINRMMSNDATLTNEEINILVNGMTPDIKAKLNIPEWFQLPSSNGLPFLKSLKFEYFQSQSV